METNNSIHKGMVSASKIPQSIHDSLVDVFAGAGRVLYTRTLSEHEATVSFSMLDGTVVVLSVKEGGRK